MRLRIVSLLVLCVINVCKCFVMHKTLGIHRMQKNVQLYASDPTTFNPKTRQLIEGIIASNKVVLFMKGAKERPQW